jgi:TrmH family RNA methyltransferase
MKRIDSATNPLYRTWKTLLTGKGIKEEGSLIVAGRKLVPEFLEGSGAKIQALVIFDPKDVEKLAFQRKTDVFWLKSSLFDELDEAGTHFPLLVMKAPPVDTADLTEAPKGLEVVLALSNPQNMGAALRSCEAFGVRRVIILEECAHPFLPKVIRASSGSSLRLNLSRGPSAAKLTPDMTELMTALDLEGDDISKTTFTKDIRIFIGEEGRGVPAGNFAKKVCIPSKRGWIL